MEQKKKKKVEKFHDKQLLEKEVKVDDGEGDNDEICYMEKLPNEMLMKILRFLNNKELLEYRLVNSQWNEICCLLHLHRKPEFGITLHGGRDGTFCSCGIRKPIDDFLKCFAVSEGENSTGSGRRPPRQLSAAFSFVDIQGLKYMDEMELCEFIFTVGPHIETLFLVVNVGDVPNFPTLWKLLLHFAPNIEHFKITGNNLSLEQITLFDRVTKFITEKDPDIKTLNPKDTFLRKLKVLEIITEYPYSISYLLEEVLEYALNMREVIIHNPTLGYSYVTPLAEEEKILPWRVLLVLRKANHLRTNKFDIKYGV